MSLTKEQETWLTNSREAYEFYLLHAILHDPLRRSSMLAVPLLPGDFQKEEAELIMHALIHAVKVMRACNLPMPSPPTMEFLKSYMESASTSEVNSWPSGNPAKRKLVAEPARCRLNDGLRASVPSVRRLILSLRRL